MLDNGHMCTYMLDTDIVLLIQIGEAKGAAQGARQVMSLHDAYDAHILGGHISINHIW